MLILIVHFTGFPLKIFHMFQRITISLRWQLRKMMRNQIFKIFANLTILNTQRFTSIEKNTNNKNKFIPVYLLWFLKLSVLFEIITVFEIHGINSTNKFAYRSPIWNV